MTVEDLMQKLSEYSHDLPVVIDTGDDETFNPVSVELDTRFNPLVVINVE